MTEFKSRRALHRLGQGEYILYGKYRIECHGYDRVTGTTWWVGFGEYGKEITRGPTLNAVVRRLETHIGQSEKICQEYPKLQRVGPDEYLYGGYFKVSPTGKDPVPWVATNEEDRLLAAGTTIGDCVAGLVRVLESANNPTINGECCI